jgi:hypothetical protein
MQAFPTVAASDRADSADQVAVGKTAATASANSSAMSRTIAFHIVPGIKAFPIVTIRKGMMLPTLVEGQSLYIDKT